MTDVVVDTRPPRRNPFSGLGGPGDFRVWVSILVVAGFLGAYALNWYRNDTQALELMNGALIGQFTGVVGYWLGSSRSSDAQAGTLNTMTHALASANAPDNPVVVPPGGTVDTNTTTTVTAKEDPA